MEVDGIQRPVCKFQRISSNGSTTSDNSSNPKKIAKGDLELQNHHHRQYPEEDEGGGRVGGIGGGGIDVVGGGGGVARLCGWPSSRIVRVSRASGGKDRHSKVLTSKGLRDRRVRLSVTTAIQFYDLQDRLGYDQPSKAVEWLLKAASSSIAELPSLDPSFPGATSQNHQQQQQLSDEKKSSGENNPEFEDPNYEDCHQQETKNNNVSVSKSSACSSTSETSKGSGLSLSRSENRIKARERAREMAAKKEKEKEKESDSTRAASVVNQVNSMSQNSSFTDLLTGGISSTTVSNNNNPNPTGSPESRTHWTTPMDYFFGRPPQSSPQIIQMPQFNITTGDHHHHHNHQQQHFSFLQESFVPVVTAAGGGETYNLNFSIASTPGGGGLAPGFNRGTLQSNLSSLLPHHHHQMHQRFQSSSMDGSNSTNLSFFMAPNAVSATVPDHFPTGFDQQRLHLCYGGAEEGGGRHSDHHKEKTKN